MGTLGKLLSYSDKFVANFLLTVLPEVLRLIILAICVIWKRFKLVKTNCKYMSMINKKTLKFTYRSNRARTDLGGCSICLSEFAERDEGRELVECNHSFHRHCLERWLKGCTPGGATCPLCRSLVVPEVIVAEYRRVQIEHEDDGSEKELALILLNALRDGTCNGFSF